MGTAGVHEGVRRMRFESVVGRQGRGDLTQIEAAEMLGVSVRTFQRWAGRFEELGAEGLCDRRLGRPSPRRAPEEELVAVAWAGDAHNSVWTTICYVNLVSCATVIRRFLTGDA